MSEQSRRPVNDLPPELAGEDVDFRSIGWTLEPEHACWEFGNDFPSYPLLPDALKATIDPVIASRVNQFRDQNPHAEKHQIIALRDQIMLEQTFRHIAKLPTEEQVVTIASLAAYCGDLEDDSHMFSDDRYRDYLRQSTHEYEYEKVTEALSRASVHPIRLHAALFAEELNNQLAEFAAKSHDPELQLFAEDMSDVSNIAARQIMHAVISYFPPNTSAEPQLETKRFGSTRQLNTSDVLNLPDQNLARQVIHEVWAPLEISPRQVKLVDQLFDHVKTRDDNKPYQSKSRYTTLLLGTTDSYVFRVDRKFVEYISYNPAESLEKLEELRELTATSHPDFLKDLVSLVTNRNMRGLLINMLLDLGADLPTEELHDIMGQIQDGLKASSQYSWSLVEAIGYGAPERQVRPLHVEEPEATLLGYRINDSIGIRLTEQIAALHALNRTGIATGWLHRGMVDSAETDTDGRPIKEVRVEAVDITSLEQIQAAIHLVNEALLAGKHLTEAPRRVVLVNEADNPDRATFEGPVYASPPQLKPDEQDRTLLSIRKSSDDNGEARLDLKRTISLKTAQALVPVLRDLLGEQFDENKFLANNRKGRDMRTFSMRLDLENFDGYGLSFDIGSTLKPEREPIGFLLASVISAGAGEFARLMNIQDNIPNNHIRSEFRPDQADPVAFGRYLLKIIRSLDKRQQATPNL